MQDLLTFACVLELSRDFTSVLHDSKFSCCFRISESFLGPPPWPPPPAFFPAPVRAKNPNYYLFFVAPSPRAAALVDWAFSKGLLMQEVCYAMLSISNWALEWSILVLFLPRMGSITSCPIHSLTFGRLVTVGACGIWPRWET